MSEWSFGDGARGFINSREPVDMFTTSPSGWQAAVRAECQQFWQRQISDLLAMVESCVDSEH